MRSFSSQAIGLLAASSVVVAHSLPKILYKDVIIVGGGSSGANAAVKLRDDYNKTIVVVEKQDILGGHVDTYVEPETGDTYDFGVQTYLDVGGARDFFERMGVEVWTPPRAAANDVEYVDFSTGKVLDYAEPDFPKVMAALQNFLPIAEKYEPMLHPGYWDFPEADKIPEELFMPFGELAEKYDFVAALPFMFKTTALGVGNPLDKMTITVLQSFDAGMARSLLGTEASFSPKKGGNQALYNAIADHLGDDILYSSTVVDTLRTEIGVVVTVRNNESGELTVILGRRILMAIEPSKKNMEPFHLTRKEHAVFDKFQYTREYAAIVSNKALPVNGSFLNLPASANDSNWAAYPEVPFTVQYDYWGNDKYFRTIVIGDENTMADDAKDLIQSDFKRLVDEGVLESGCSPKLKVVDFSDHGPMHLFVSEEEYKDGFVQKQYDLQGYQSTWWTGAAFSCQFSTELWAYNDILLPKMVKDMESGPF